MRLSDKSINRTIICQSRRKLPIPTFPFQVLSSLRVFDLLATVVFAMYYEIEMINFASIFNIL